MKARIIAACFVFSGAVLFSVKAILVKIAYRDFEIDSVTLLLLRMLFSLPFYIAILLYDYKKNKDKPLGTRRFASIVILGFVGYYLASFLDFWGLRYITAGLERLILFTYPTMVLLISAIVFRRRISKLQLMALALTYAGIAIAFLADVNIQNQKDIIFGGLLIFGSATAFAVYLVGSGRLLMHVGSVRFTAYAMIVSSVCVIVHHSFHSGAADVLALDQELYIIALLMAVFSTVIPSFLLMEGIRRMGAENSSIIGSVGPVSTIILGYFFLGENFTLIQIFGTAIVITGVLLISLKGK